MMRRLADLLLVDGYNMIGAWPELIALKDIHLEEARDVLLQMLGDYQGYSGKQVYVVFDAHFMPGQGSTFAQYGVQVIFTKERETADTCIERLANVHKSRLRSIYVATSDMAEQHVIFGTGALRMSARELLTEVKQAKAEITRNIDRDAQPSTARRHEIDQRMPDDVRMKLERLRRGQT